MAKLQILIADDEVHICRMLQKTLTTPETEVVAVANDGNKAVEQFKAHRPDILLLDINMPFRTGLEALQQIRAEFPEAFVIMLTSVADAGTVQSCLEAGAASYILKDTPLPEIRRMVQQAWQEYKAETAR